MKRKYTRSLEFKSDKILTVSDLRSLVEWIGHIGLEDDHRVFVFAEDTQREGYYFVATVTVDDTPVTGEAQ